MRVTSLTPIVRKSEAGVIIDVQYEGELDDGTKVSRTLFGVQDALLMYASPEEGLKTLALNDLRRVNDAHEAEKARRAALESLAIAVQTVRIETPIEPPPEEESAEAETTQTEEEPTVLEETEQLAGEEEEVTETA